MTSGMWVGEWHDGRVEDRALVDAVLDGDRDAFTTLVQRELPSVYRTVVRIVRDPHEAEDVAQEAFLAAYRSLPSYRAEGPVRAWLLRIATRLAFRRAARARPAPLDDGIAERLTVPADLEPLRAVVGRERQEEIRRAVASLAEPYREIVALRFFAELSLTEIADATGRPLNPEKTHLRRGLQRLEPILGGTDR